MFGCTLIDFGCISSLCEGTTMLQRSLNLSPAVLVELDGHWEDSRENLPQIIDYVFSAFFSMLFPSKWGVSGKLSLKPRPNVACAKALCAQGGSWQGWSQGRVVRKKSFKNRHKNWMVRKSTVWFNLVSWWNFASADRKKNQACQLCERSLYRAKCWQGAGERDQSISWDPINVNVSNEAGHGQFEVVEIHGTHHGFIAVLWGTPNPVISVMWSGKSMVWGTLWWTNSLLLKMAQSK